jgi:DUF4097 and DUF4098 domain-containing protein YvlB
MIDRMAGVERMRILPVPDGVIPEIRIGSASGRVTLVAEDRTSVEVSASRAPRQRFEFTAEGLLDLSHAFGASAIVEIRCPSGTHATIGTASGRVMLDGRFGRVRVTSVSGSIQLDRARAAELRTVSGKVEAAELTDLARISTRSGNVAIGSSAIAEVSTASGRISVGPVSGDVRAQSVSGRIELATNGAASVHARSVSGPITVQLPRGTRPKLLVLSGRSGISFAGEQGDDCTCRLQSVSGRIQVEYQ